MQGLAKLVSALTHLGCVKQRRSLSSVKVLGGP